MKGKAAKLDVSKKSSRRRKMREGGWKANRKTDLLRLQGSKRSFGLP